LQSVVFPLWTTLLHCVVVVCNCRVQHDIQMNVYETRGSRSTVPGPGPPPGSGVGLGQVKPGTVGEPKKGFRPPQHCPTLAQVVSRKVQAAVPEEGLVRFYNPMVLHNHRHSHCCCVKFYTAVY